MKKYFANYKFPALTSIGFAALGLLLIVIGWCIPWFTTSLGDVYLLDSSLSGGVYPLVCTTAFLSTVLSVGAVAVLFFAPVAKTKPWKAVQYSCLALLALVGILTVVFSAVFAKHFGEDTKALGGAYLIMIGTVVMVASLCFKRISKRRLIQVYAALLVNANLQGFVRGTIYQGGSKYVCSPGLNCYSCPGAVGACPLGALQNAMANSGTTAPFYVLGILLLFGLLLGRAICGWLCPVGLGQELLYKIPTPKLKKNRYTRVFSYFKYFLLAVFVIAIPLMYGLGGFGGVPAFCKYICPAGTFGGGVGLLVNPANSGWFETLGPLFTWKFALMVAVVVGCIFCYRGFCRFLCPLGALYGFFNKISLFGIKLDKNKCTDCGLCVAHCKMDIKKVGDHECISCGECISVCPAKAISFKGSKLFVHANAVESIPAPSEEKPLGALLKNEAAIAENAVPVSEVNAPETAAPAKKNKKPARFWVQLGVWISCLVLLASALLYYNVFATTEEIPNEGTEIGNVIPDLHATIYGGGAHFYLHENLGERGTVIVLFDEEEESARQIGNIQASRAQFSQTYNAEWAEKTKLYAIHAGADGDLSQYIADQGWNDTEFAFGQDSVVNSFFEALVTEEVSLPLTLVLDTEGIILHKFEGVMETHDILFSLASPYAGVNVGDICPDFTIREYGYDENGTYGLLDRTFALSEHYGEIIVINFWATWCAPCVAEIPFFEQLKQTYPDVTVVAIQGIEDTPVPAFIQASGWTDYGVTFAQDNIVNDACVTYKKFGGIGAWPTTFILNKDRVITFTRQNSITYDKLAEEVQKLL